MPDATRRAELILALKDEISAGAKSAGDAVAGLGAKSQGAGEKIGESGAQIGKMGAAAEAVKGQLMTLGKVGLGALEAGLVASVVSAGKLQTSMAQIAALTNTPRAAIQGLTQDVIAMSREMPISAQELAEGLYFVSSSGFEGAEAMDILRASAKAASAGLGETKTIADAVTSALNAYKLQGKDAARITDILTMAVKEGKGEPAELAGSLGRVLPVAAAAGVSMEQVAASLATMTRTGMSADEAATALRGTIGALLAPSKESVEALAGIGLTVEDVANKLKGDGLVSLLQLLMERTGGNVEAMDKLIPNIRALTGVLSTAGSQSADYAEILDKMANAAGTTDAAFTEMSNTFEFKLKKAQNSLENLGTAIGNKLLPPLSDAADAAATLINWQDKLNAAFENASGNIEKTAKTYKEYKSAVIETAVAAGKLSRAEADSLLAGKRVIQGGMGQVDITQKLTTAIELQTESQFRLGRAMNGVADYSERVKAAMSTAGAATTSEAEAAAYNAVETEKMRKEKEKAEAAELKMAKAFGEAKQNFLDETAAFKEFEVKDLIKKQMEAISAAMKQPGADVEGLGRMYRDLQMQLGEVNQPAIEAQKAFGALSEMQLRGYLTGSDLNTVLGKLKAAAADGKVDVNELGLSAGQAAVYMDTLTDSANNATNAINLIPREVNVNVRMSGEVSDDVVPGAKTGGGTKPGPKPSPKPKPNGNCFVAGTLITLADGSVKPIESIEVGDVVLSFDADGRFTDGVVTALVRSTTRELYTLATSAGRFVQCTGEHPFYAPRVTRQVRRVHGNFIRAKDLRVGDVIGCWDSTDLDDLLTVISTETVEDVVTSIGVETVDETPVYNFNVEDHHTYIANGYLVHNVKSNANAASGFNGVIPPGYPNDSYLIGVSSGERVVVVPSGGTTINNYRFDTTVTGSSGQNVDQLAEAVGRQLSRKFRSARSSGAGYAGG